MVLSILTNADVDDVAVDVPNTVSLPDGIIQSGCVPAPPPKSIEETEQ